MQVYGNNEMMTGSLRPRLALARALQHQHQLGLQLQLTGGRLARHRSVLANGVAGVAAAAVAVVYFNTQVCHSLFVGVCVRVCVRAPRRGRQSILSEINEACAPVFVAYFLGLREKA